MAKRVVLSVGTKRGLFLLESGIGRKKWKVSGPFLKGWQIPYAVLDTRSTPRIHVGASHFAFGPSAQSATLKRRPHRDRTPGKQRVWVVFEKDAVASFRPAADAEVETEMKAPRITLFASRMPPAEGETRPALTPESDRPNEGLCAGRSAASSPASSSSQGARPLSETGRSTRARQPEGRSRAGTRTTSGTRTISS